MPIHKTSSGGFQWGSHGRIYASRAGAERQAAAAHANGFHGDSARAAGVALRAPDGALLFLRRSDAGDHPGEWCFPGGHAETSEAPIDTAMRELKEETGFGPERLSPMIALGYDESFMTFGADVSYPMTPILNAEHTAFSWAQPQDAPEPTHPGVKALLSADAPEQALLSKKIAELVSRGYPEQQAIAVIHSEARGGAVHKDHAGYYAPQAIGKTRRVTPEGWLVLEGTPIARTGEQLYSASELEGLEANGAGYIIVTRPPEEVFRSETMASFEGKDFVINHPPDGVDPDNWKNHTVGHIQNIRRGEGVDDDLLLADVLVKDPAAIQHVNKRLPEISAGYNADYEQTEPGKAVCRNIIGNHAAAVQAGRAGARVAVRDSAAAVNQPDERITTMSKRHFGAGMREALVRLGLKTADVSKLEEEHGEDAEATNLTGDAVKDAVRDAMGAFDKRLGDIETQLKDRNAKDAEKEEEEKKQKASEDAVRRSKDAEREAAEKKEAESEATGDTLIEAEEVGHTINLGKTWTGGMTGDSAEPVLSSVVARAEILAPGIAKPTIDSLKGSRGKALADFMRKTLTTHASKDAAGAETVRAFTLGKSVSDLRGSTLVAAFHGAAEVVRSRNNAAGKTVVARGQRTGDFSKPSDIPSINERNQKFWKDRAVGSK